MKALLLFFLLTGFTFYISAQVKSTISNGSWFDPNIWSPVGVPLMEDTVIINHDLTVSGNYVDFGANWLIVNQNASITGDTIFALHGNLKLFGTMNLNIIAVGDGDSTQIYGTVQGRKYAPGNPYNFNYTGYILSDTLILGDSFENYGIIDVMDLIIGGSSIINHSSANLSASVSAVMGGPTNNEVNAIMDFYSLISADNFTNNGMVYCNDWTHAQGTVNGATGKFCVENCFTNVSTINGTVDICDNTPGGFCDMNMGTIAPTVTTCASGPCSALSLTDKSENKVEIFPNPAHSEVSIEVSSPGNIILYNTFGQELSRHSIQKSIKLPVDNFESGMYYLQNEGKMYKILIQR